MKRAPVEVLAVDFETVSGCPISAGAWVYSRHESTRMWVAVFGFDCPRSGRTYTRWRPGEHLGGRLRKWLESDRPIVAHNAAFERSVWDHVACANPDVPRIAHHRWRDTQVLGCAVNLPPTLEGLAAALGCPTQKDTEGAALMKRLATAWLEEGRWVYPTPTAEELERLSAYCETDVKATLDCWRRLPPLSVVEERVVATDARVNARGVYLDREFARGLRAMAKLRSDRLADRVWDVTSGELPNATSAPALKAWAKGRGVTLPKVPRKRADGTRTSTESLDRNVASQLLKSRDLDPLVRAVLEVKLEAGKATSLAKLARVESMTDEDGRLRDALLYCGALTGRWTSYGLQVHNLPKNKLDDATLEAVRRCVAASDVDTLDILTERPLEALSQLLRSVIAAAPGCDLIAADFSAIEARVLPWLAGQTDVLDFLFDYDRELLRFRRGERPDKPRDLYEFAAAKIESDDRQLGKVATLALGYGMGDVKFVTTAASWGVPLENKVARRVKNAWRESNDRVVSFWGDLESAVKEEIENPTPGGVECRRIRVEVSGSRAWLRLVLPSGRALYYWRPQLVERTRKIEVMDEDGTIVEREMSGVEVQFWTVDKDKVRMRRESTYGGKLVENVTQAVARDLLGEALDRVEASDPYRVVMHVHDSIAAEVPAGTGSPEEFERLMSVAPSWADGLPLAAEGYRDRFFRG